jgi:DNA-binding LacI/PurR family transcriptional regulator
VVTREDVAKRAGVSVSAVSRTMNGRGYVAEDKKMAVLQAVRELGYRPNPAGAVSESAQTNQLCFLCRDTANPFYMELFSHMTGYADELGYTMFLFSKFNANRFCRCRMDGVIVESEDDALMIQKQIGENAPVPIVSAAYGIPVVHTKRIPYVNADTYDAMEIGLHYLIRKGHRKIAYAAPGLKSGTGLVHSRYAAYENIMRPLLGKRYERYLFTGGRSQSADRSILGDPYFESGKRAAQTFLESGCDATAVIGFNDSFSLGMLNRFAQAGRKIPEELSVMGIDGISSRQYVSPLLTTVSLCIEEQARRCVDVLLDRIAGKKVGMVTSVRPHLLEGESVNNCR